jgi:predicted phosphodiesterase
MAVRRVAALYDVHANLPALDAVLAEVEDLAPDVIVVGGDVVTGPMPTETLDRLSALRDRVRWVRGNADREAMEAREHGRPSTAFSDVAERAAAWTAAHLTPAHADLVASFEEGVVIDVDDLGPVLFCHGSPRSDEEIVTSATSDERLLEILDGVTEPTVVCGHTHRHFDRVSGRHRIVNAGSIGMPYEGDAAAFWLVVGPDIELRRTAYDVEATAETMRATGFPDIEEMIGDSLLNPADPDWVAGFFEARATGREPPPEPAPTA